MSRVRGDVHELPAPRGARGHEQTGRRYGVMVESDDLPLSTVLVAPISTSARASRERAELDAALRPVLALD